MDVLLPLRAMVTARVNLYFVQRKILLSPKTFRDVFVLIKWRMIRL